jgi:outer membrane receptor protein involved in Fe transport
MRTKTQLLSNLLATTVFCGALGVATPAFAQDNATQTQPQSGPVEATTNAQSANGQADDQAIVITGSRIPQPNLTSTSPVTVVNSAEVRASGTTRTEDLVNSLPQVFAGQSSTVSNGSSGTATLNLRGIGVNRTLVLINGRRLVPGDPGLPVADINVIPAMMIQRVDVLTGGASSVYGADAVAGVVNFIMDTNFTGIRMDSQYSFYQHDNSTNAAVIAALNARGYGFPTGNVADGGTWDTNMAIGAAFDDNRGHVVAYAGYRHIDQITQGRRDYSACALTSRTAAQIAAGPGAGGVTTYTCGGSATSANGTFFTNVGTFQVGPNRTFIAGSTPYNFNPTNFYQRPDERYTFGAFANYEISDALKPYLEAMFMDDRTVAQIAPSGDFGNTFTVNCDNPLLSAQQRSIVCSPNNLVTANGQTVNQRPAGTPPQAFIDPTTGLPYFRGALQILRRNVEGGGRRDDLQHTNYRIVAGMRGDLSPAWSYDLYYQFGQTNFAETYSNDFSIRRLSEALDVVNVGGVPTCRARVSGVDPGCVPWDIFALNSVSPASLAFLQTPGLQRGVVQETVANASMTGDLGNWGIQMPWAHTGLGVAFGVEYRKESLELLVDQAFSTLPSSDLAGQGAPTLPASGSFDVREAFAEVRLPIIEENFIYNLSLEGGYRYSDYTVRGRSFSTDTYKAAIDFAPIRDIRFRASYNRAVRAPNVQELFATQRVVLDGSTDPCATGVPITAAQTGCIASGAVVGQTIQPNPANQYNGLVGGNPNLNPEIADTYTIGLVLQPRFIPHFAVTVDWFNIKLKGAIQGVGADRLITGCVSGTNPSYCALIHRDQFGSLWRSANGYVADLSINTGQLSTRGIDVQASYSMDIGRWGGLSMNFVGTWLDHLTADGLDCAGLYAGACGTPNPEWRHTARLSWNGPDGIGLSGRWRYFSAVDNIGTTRTGDLRIPAQSYFDLTLTARIGDHYNFRLGVNNILDKDPPLVGANACPAGICNGNSYTQVYDALGRYIFAGVTLDF